MTRFSSPFIKQTSFEVEYAPAYITKWKSQRTGLQITYINQPSPIVNGYFAVATEIENNSGCPHTLEHLIFMGSKKYPYKGLLDSLGNRLYSQTNAWTGVDQTVYTLTTAGWDGFKTLLPIYLDHLFHPTLTDEARLTEVYHVDGKGKEKGVVFSEMQGIESQSWFVTFKKMQETLYSPKSGYSSETGGLMSELRNLTNDQIKEFHKSMYRPDNLCVIITGSIDQDELLQIMTEFDNELPPKSNETSRRPFVDSKHDEPLKEDIVKTIEFPEKDESTGEVLISWIGPEGNDSLINTAIDMIGAYFTDGPISLFNKHLVEVENPLATDIEYTTDDYYKTALNFTCNGVPTDKLNELQLKIKELIQTQTNPDNMNLLYLRQIINQQRLKFVSQTEKSASSFSNIAILEFIYGNPDGSDLLKWTKDLKEYDELLTWTSEQWSSLIRKYFIDNKSATILGKPSSKLNEFLKKENKKFNKQIKQNLGENGLNKLKNQLIEAQNFNDRPIPEELLTQFIKPDPSKISFIKTKSYKAGKTKGIVDKSTNQYIENDEFSEVLVKDTPPNFPMFIHFESFKSQFSTIQLVMSSTKIRPELLKYMSIIEEIFSMSLKLPNGKYISYEQVISDLNRDLLEFQLDNGYDYQFLELISITVKFENQNYKKAIDWLYKIINFIEFEESRIKIIIEKLLNSLPDKKRNGELMMYSCQYRKLFNNKSLRKEQDSINTESFYRELLDKINNGEFSQIKSDLEEIKTNLFKLDNIKIIILGNAPALENPISSWNQFITPITNQELNIQPFANLPRSFQFKSEQGLKCNHEAYLINIPATESTHLISITSIPTDYLNDDIPRISLAIEFLCAVEGPFWRAIRGTGLSYGVNIKKNLETGFLTFSIYRGSDAKQAWIEAEKIIKSFVDETNKIDSIALESCIATIINEIANNQESNYESATSKISDNLFKLRGPNFIENYLRQLNQLTAADIVYILKKYFLNLFDSSKSVVFTSLPTEKIEEIGEFFNGKGYNINIEEIQGIENNNEDGDENEGMSESEEEDDDDDETGSEEESETDDSEDEENENEIRNGRS
ncbi:uncharacterized protein KGF55_005133 [Candida pseudojiufengensis]|uniref:uncharacterized protein n=1 Tax=Candida pseudojiufengensis TaxID=497109 RepID=UPI0022250A5A|nr:uncharacterized protein KGF55_005133 [Candida pseudojiufengensis]KAI5959901.1 hypothetical protein KGF55_005133 [Candida pseudojiufengensis]